MKIEDLNIEELNAYAQCTQRICSHFEQMARSEHSNGTDDPAFIKQNTLLLHYNLVYEKILNEIRKRLNNLVQG